MKYQGLIAGATFSLMTMSLAVVANTTDEFVDFIYGVSAIINLGLYLCAMVKTMNGED